MLTSSILLPIAIVTIVITIIIITKPAIIIKGETEAGIAIAVAKVMKAKANGNLKVTFRKVIMTIITITRGATTAVLAFAFNL